MGGIGLILGGALAGFGDGLEKQTASNEEDQRQQNLLAATQARETALENLRAKNQAAAADHQAALDDTKDANHQARGFSYGTAENTQKQSFEQQNIRLKGSVDLNNDKQVAALKQQYDLTDIQVKATADLQNQLALAGQTADHWGVTTDGRMVAFNKQGGVLRYSANPSSFIPSGKSESDDGTGSLGGDGSIAGERANRGGGAKPRPAAASTTAPQSSSGDIPGQRGAALAKLGNVYTQIAANPSAKAEYMQQYPGMFDQDGNLLPRNVLIQRVNQRYGG